jgi:hypothetical protein
MKNIKDIGPYLPLYLNQNHRYSWVEEPDTFTAWIKLLPHRLARLDDFSIAKVQLQLRKLSSMTEEEARQLISIRGYEKVESVEFKDDGIEFTHPGFTTWIKLTPDSPEAFLYLLSIGMDLFNLIPEGLAIERKEGE